VVWRREKSLADDGNRIPNLAALNIDCAKSVPRIIVVYGVGWAHNGRKNVTSLWAESHHKSRPGPILDPSSARSFPRAEVTEGLG
jgi:hypothetical protein